MKTAPIIWRVDPKNPGRAGILEAAALLARGGLVVYPTETFYGLGAVPTLEGAVARVFEAKGREAIKALPLIASGKEAVLRAVSGWPDEAETLARLFWPGPLTLILPASSRLPSALHAGTGKIAVRISPHPVAALLAESAGGLIVSTSANRSGEAAPRLPEEISPDLMSGVDGIIEAGILPGGFPSTIVDVSAFPPRLVRAGALDWDAVSGALALGG